MRASTDRDPATDPPAAQGAAGNPEKRVVLFGPWPPPYGGVASHMQDLARNLAARGVPTRLLCYGDFRTRWHVRRISVVRPGWWRSLPKLYLTLSPRTILHDHSGMIPNPDEGLLESLASAVRRRGARWILTLHDETLPGRFRGWPRTRRELCTRFLRCPEHVICVGDRLHAFLEELGIADRNLSNIPPLLPVADLPEVPLPPAVQAFLADHTPVIATVGAFHANYDLGAMARAFPRILREYPRAGLVVIDAGFTADDASRRQVLEGLEDTGAGAYCLLSRIPRDHVLQILRASAVFVRGTRYESFGLSRVEALLLGTPVVTTEAGETRHMRTYAYGDPIQLAHQVLVVLEVQPDLSEAQRFYRTMAEQTLDRILGVYDRTSC
jgi:glycosyltransferase involved in cell wall biosynthesis